MNAGSQQPPDSLAAQPRALIVTIYGLYGRDADGWLSIAALIRLMSGLGAEEPAVRSAISRLKQRGLLEPRRAGGAAGYGLTGQGQAIVIGVMVKHEDGASMKPAFASAALSRYGPIGVA